jgi:DNA repair photolyase
MLDNRRRNGEHTEVLFPDLQGANRLVGIARLASEGELLDAKRRVEYRDLPTRRFIGRASGRKMPFEWTINPYRGCEFGCKYCYARFTHEFLELRDTVQFETLIYAKQFMPQAFRRELAHVPRTDGICLGTATDPYQPAERRYEVTRRILHVFAEEYGRSLSITTKSDLVTRDLDLLKVIAQRNILHVFMTITTTDEHLARLLEPYAPRPSLRVAALGKLAAAGIRSVVLASPLMPLINDSRANLNAVAKAAAGAGAVYLMGGVLFLKPCAQKAFFPFVEERFPHLLRRYREHYERGAFLKGHYPEMMKQRLREVRAAHGLTKRPEPYEPDQWLGDPQMQLFDTC